MIIDHDIIQRIKVSGIFILQFYKVMTGTLLTLFVPQACPEEIRANSNIIQSPKICSLTQNFENNDSR